MSVIVPAHNAEATLGRMLECLAAQEVDFEWELIVVDDGSTDRTAELARAASLPVRLLREEGVGPAAARNSGVAAAKGQRLAFLDSDCYPTPRWLASGLRALEAADLVQGGVLPDPFDDAPSPWDHVLSPGDVGLFESANLFVRRPAFEAVGGFRDPLRLPPGGHMGEDTWFAWRAKRAGARAIVRSDVLVHHAIIKRRWWEHVAEGRRLGHFPALLVLIPELRAPLCFGWVFLSPRTAAFDLALAGSVAAARRRSPLPLVALLPYALVEGRERLRRRRSARLRIVVGDLLRDSVGFAALVGGSVRARSPLL